ncbi:hypothetical protein QZH41_010741 [Actinostola sp. cb2023]|nr:hypothetical protein QZH41_010741 [Actinostola sp. cb2023]
MRNQNFVSRFARLSSRTSAKMAFSGLHTGVPSANKSEFRSLLSGASKVLFLSGAGVSAESGIPTFRGAGGLWRTYEATELATPQAFDHNPSLVWEFYSYRREVVLSKKPNPAHYAIAEFQKKLRESGKHAWVVTQNIDGFHQAAGAQDVVELHGKENLDIDHETLFPEAHMFTIKKCSINQQQHLVPFSSRAPDPNAKDANIPESDLPRCSQPGCDSLVRPDVVWFGESLSDAVLSKTQDIMDSCDFCIIVRLIHHFIVLFTDHESWSRLALVGTSSVVYPAAMFAPKLAKQGVPVAEFNLEQTDCSGFFRFHFVGKAGETLPPLLAE